MEGIGSVKRKKETSGEGIVCLVICRWLITTHAKHCSNPHDFISNCSGDPEVSKDTKYYRLNFGETCKK